MDTKSATYLYGQVIENEPITVVCGTTEKGQDEKQSAFNKNDNVDVAQQIRIFSLMLHGVTVELNSVGACISKWLVPSFSVDDLEKNENKDDDEPNDVYVTSVVVATASTDSIESTSKFEDDIVLGFDSPLEMYETRNPIYLGAVVGRVANRIANGEFELNDRIYKLEVNNPPNHLHGGSGGFSNQLWNSDIVSIPELPCENGCSGQGVQFTFVSKDGDQGYPGSMKLTATYFLRSALDSNVSPLGGGGSRENVEASENVKSVTLCLCLQAELLQDDATGKDESQQPLCTPINLAQHSYFNLSSHSDPRGILDHNLSLPNCDAYTPVNDISIPTREVRLLSKDPVMDFRLQNNQQLCACGCRRGRRLSQALRDYGIVKAKVSKRKAQRAISSSFPRIAPKLAVSKEGTPYGFDHNYVVGRHKRTAGTVMVEANGHSPHNTWEHISRQHEDSSSNLPADYQAPSSLHVVGVLEHPGTGRSLTVKSDVPGVQLYTSNYLDGTIPARAKDDAVYRQWQGLCLETQHFPDSINVEEEKYPHFAEGRCVILGPQRRTYEQNVEYELTFGMPQCRCNDGTDETDTSYDDEDTDDDDDDEDGDKTFFGRDGQYNQYASPEEMWNAQGVVGDSCSEWYNRAAKYYEENCPATINGVLGGFANISELDLQGSRDFVQSVLEALSGRLQLSAGAACECGAGIGRVTKGLLLSLGVTRCDLVESSSRLLSAAPQFIGDENCGRCRFFCSGLQEWYPKPSTYSIIWIQWVLCYLTDTDAVAFLRRCGEALMKDTGGIIVVKENTCTSEDFVVDEQDASVTRSISYLKHLAAQAGLRLILERRQTNFPDDIFPVPMLAFEVER